MKAKYFYYLIIALFSVTACKLNNKNSCNVVIDKSINSPSIQSQIKDCSTSQIDSLFFDYFVQSDYLRDSSFSKLPIEYYKKLKISNNEIEKYNTFQYLTKAIAFNKSTQFDSSEIYTLKAKANFEKYNYKWGIVNCDRLLASIYNYTGNYAKSFEHRNLALDYYAKIKDSLNYYEVKSDLSVNYFFMKDYNEAIKNSKETLRFYENNKDTFMQAYQESLLSVYFAKQKKYDSSKVYAQRSLEKRIALNDLHDIGESYNNLSLSQMAMGNWNEALMCLNKADSLMTLVGDLRQLPIIRLNIAKAKNALGATDEALAIYLKNIEETRKSHQKEALLGNIDEAIAIYKKKGDYVKLSELLEESKNLNQDLFDVKNTKETIDLKNKFAIQSRQQMINQLNYEKKTTRYLILLSAFVGLLIIAVLVLQIRKKKLIVKNKEIELWGNRRQLELMTENILKKNKLIEELENNIQENSNIILDENNEQLSQLYQFKILTEDDWQEFKILFDKVHPGLINKLRSTFPELTPAEERQFLLIRLKIDNAECANMLGVSKETVIKNRYRLKKRFELGSNVNLDEYVESFT